MYKILQILLLDLAPQHVLCLRNLPMKLNMPQKFKCIHKPNVQNKTLGNAGNISRHLAVRFGSIHAIEFSFHEKVIKHHYYSGGGGEVEDLLT